MEKICSGFGHRNVFQDISNNVNNAIGYAIKEGCTVFYTGIMGQFDKLFALGVKRAKSQYPDIQLICVMPYLTKKLQDNNEYYYSMYDDIIIPTELADIHYKSIITKRNEWIIDKSNLVVIYTIRDDGGSYNALKYAEKQNKTILRI